MGITLSRSPVSRSSPAAPPAPAARTPPAPPPKGTPDPTPAAARRCRAPPRSRGTPPRFPWSRRGCSTDRSEEHTSELQSRLHLVCRLLLEKKKMTANYLFHPPQENTTVLNFTLSLWKAEPGSAVPYPLRFALTATMRAVTIPITSLTNLA